MLNRSSVPANSKINHFFVNEAEKYILSQGTAVYCVKDNSCDVLRVEFFYSGGVIHQQRKGQAIAAANLLPEGTSHKTAEEIAKSLDFFGAYLQTSANRDESSVTLYCLPKHLKNCFIELREILQDACYPETEVSVYQSNALQTLEINEEKTAYLAKRAFNKAIYGEEFPYGSSVNQQDINNISRETLLEFSRAKFKRLPKYIIISGNVSQELIQQLELLFSGFEPHELIASPQNNVSNIYQPSRLFVEKKNATQSSVKIGKRFINRENNDYREMTVVNMLLGGYFGSRLMKNIREEKGLTYGIYSSIEPLFYGSAFSISVELNNELIGVGVEEIFKELEKLRSTLVSENELEVVRNYYLGSFLRGFDGVFSLASYCKTLIDYNLDYTYYYDYLNVINNITPERIMDLSKKYLNPTDMSVVIAGKKNV